MVSWFKLISLLKSAQNPVYNRPTGWYSRPYVFVLHGVVLLHFYVASFVTIHY